jgi:hypothetical protein
VRGVSRIGEYAPWVSAALLLGITFWFLTLAAKALGYSDFQSYFVAALALLVLGPVLVGGILLGVKHRRELRIFFYENPKNWLYAALKLMVRFTLRTFLRFLKWAIPQALFAVLLYAYARLGFWVVRLWNKLRGEYVGGSIFTSYSWQEVIVIALFAGMLGRLTFYLLEWLFLRIRNIKWQRTSRFEVQIPTVWIAEPKKARIFAALRFVGIIILGILVISAFVVGMLQAVSGLGVIEGAIVVATAFLFAMLFVRRIFEEGKTTKKGGAKDA